MSEMIEKSKPMMRVVAALVALFAIVASAGCATTSAVPGTTPVGLAVDGSIVPPAPAGRTGALARLWNDLRAGRVSAVDSELAASGANDTDARTLRGFVDLLSGDTASAQVSFQAVLAVTPRNAAAMYGMGRVAALGGQRQTARQWYESSLQAESTLAEAAVALRLIDLEDARRVLFDADRAAAAGDTEAATTAYRQAIVLAPELERPHLSLALILAEAGSDGAALDVLRNAHERLGDHPAILEPLADALTDADELADALEAYERLRDALADDDRAARLAAEARRRWEITSLPEPYRRLGEMDVIERQDLAAALIINLGDLDGAVTPRQGTIISDLEEGWATTYIHRAVALGLMEVYQNRVFWPDLPVTRQMLAEVCYRVLEIVDLAGDAPRVPLQDPPREHIMYRQIQAVVGLGIMSMDRGGTFLVLDRVSGQETIDTLQRLARLLRQRGRI